MVSVLFSIVFPTLGTILSNIMVCSSLLVVRLSRRQRFLSKSVNPVPWAMASTKCIAWLIYGVLISDVFIIISNSLGALASVFSLTSALVLLGASRDPRDWRYVGYMETIILLTICVWLAIAYTVVVTRDAVLGTTFVGYYALFTTVLMYTSSLSSIVSIITLKDASFIYLPQAIASALNSFCWLLYGFFAVNNPILYTPSIIGLLTSVPLIILKLTLPSKLDATEAPIKKLKLADDVSDARDRAQSAVSGTSSGPSQGREYRGALVDTARPRRAS